MSAKSALLFGEEQLTKKIRVVIISADGPTFSAGHDLKELTEGRENPDKGREYFKKIYQQKNN